MLDDDALLSRSFELAVEARAKGDHPFGALLGVAGEIVAEARNLVNTNHDVTAHAETTLVWDVQRAGQLDLLAVGTVFASCEPCPMCLGAMYWAGARTVVFGLSAKRLYEIGTVPGGERFGFAVNAAEIVRGANPPMSLSGPNREDEAAESHAGFWVPSGAGA